jgi:hypothetical protein
MLGWAWLTSGWSLGHGEGPAWHACLREGGGVTLMVLENMAKLGRWLVVDGHIRPLQKFSPTLAQKLCLCYHLACTGAQTVARMVGPSRKFLSRGEHFFLLGEFWSPAIFRMRDS